MKRLQSPDVVVPGTAQVGEGPVLDHRTGRLCWVDITEGEIFQSDLATGETTAASVGMMVGAIAPRRDQAGFAVAAEDGFGMWADGCLTVLDPVLPEPYRRMNDAKCDSRGRLWAGSNHKEFEPGTGLLHRWDGRGPSTVIARGLTLPNGIGWSPDDATMYLADSMEHRLMAVDYRPDEGEIGQLRTLAAVEDGYPDGLAVDVDGCVWLAVWGAGQVRCHTPDGTVVAVVDMPVTQPSSCAFGSDGTLYITSARNGLTAGQLAAQPHAGSVFAVATGTTGVPVHPFEG
ncbi:SMP-30/gluconolactonase/LRE family protein [Nonomuraea sp. NPDC000554]|uniref:SMP-30/gluconolactonase/LRE family protein n=1 Tax=Nonomuraea sp. NPDC000554 TaxID=3154259 RepID=UPI00332ADF24